MGRTNILYGVKTAKGGFTNSPRHAEKEGGKLDDKEKATLRAQIKTLEKEVEVAEAKDASISSAEKTKRSGAIP